MKIKRKILLGSCTPACFEKGGHREIAGKSIDLEQMKKNYHQDTSQQILDLIYG